jgi:hypothetical protein
VFLNYFVLVLQGAFLEHTNRHMCRRIFPKPMPREEAEAVRQDMLMYKGRLEIR